MESTTQATPLIPLIPIAHNGDTRGAQSFVWYTPTGYRRGPLVVKPLPCGVTFAGYETHQHRVEVEDSEGWLLRTTTPRPGPTTLKLRFRKHQEGNRGNRSVRPSQSTKPLLFAGRSSCTSPPTYANACSTSDAPPPCGRPQDEESATSRGLPPRRRPAEQGATSAYLAITNDVAVPATKLNFQTDTLPKDDYLQDDTVVGQPKAACRRAQR